MTNGVSYVSFMYLTHPCHKFSRLITSEFTNLLVHGKTCLLDDIGPVKPSFQLWSQLLDRQSPQVVSMQIEQSSQSDRFARSSARNQPGNFVIGCRHVSVSLCDIEPSTNETQTGAKIFRNVKEFQKSPKYHRSSILRRRAMLGRSRKHARYILKKGEEN